MIRHRFLYFFGILLAGVLAFVIVYPTQLQARVNQWNSFKQSSTVFNYLPFLPHLPHIPFQLGLDIQGGIQLLYDADLSSIESGEYSSAMQGLRDVIERRVNLFGVAEPVVQTEGIGAKRRLIVELAGIKDPKEAIRLIGLTPYLDFREPKPNFDEILENNRKALETNKGELEDPYQPTQLNGRYLKKAGVDYDTLRKPVITLDFNEEGAKLFADITGRLVGKPLAIYLDGQKLQDPIVQSRIEGGRAQITGNFTTEEAARVARDLNAGALPVPISLVSQQSVGATLGASSFQTSVKAGLAGLVVVVFFMLFFYRLSGAFAALALLFYVVFMLVLFKLIPVTLTLAGIAGFVLSIGMAVDANILIFSRTREELAAKKSFQTSLEDGFKRAWPSIRDGNITALLVALILFWLGSSFVKGFAFTLSLGILLSMFSAVFVTRTFLSLFIGTKLEKYSWLW